MTRTIAAMGLSLAIAGAASTLAGAQTTSCRNCVEARYWEVSPTFWTSATSEPSVPERPRLDALRKDDVGVAFSGGGTRSASASIGQLRALKRNGWLSHVRYVTAVSGGSWAAVPFTFYRGSLDDLLGADAALDAKTIETVPAGLLAERVINSKLGHVGLHEVPSFLSDSVGGVDIGQYRRILLMARSAIRRIRKREVAEPDRQNKTYAHLLGQIFLDRLVPEGNRRLYAWDRETAIEMSKASGRPAGEFIIAPPDRPFLIVGGTLVKQNGADYPRLIPVEYTPLYTGVRQRFGLIGGTYFWPWAYDRLFIAPRSETHALVGPGPEERPFTLADVIASSGAAPQLTLLLGDRVPARFRSYLQRAADAFPAFSNLAVHGGMPNPATAELAHGDGGFTDNLGIMPLLVRQVHNVIVFVNSSSDYTQNEQLQSYFMPLRLRDGNGDKSMNPVFDAAKYQEVLDGFDTSTAGGGGAIHCGRNWEVKANEVYNIRRYTGLNICFVYNYAGAKWKASLPERIKSWVTPPDPLELTNQAKDLQRFPYYRTFGENRTRVIQLKPLQVNLLADLAAWSISNPAAVDAILAAFDKGVLPRPATTR
jgi:Patatin-like phospholipase